MSLTPGTRLGPYEITDAIGAGGMGEVYKARDTRLDRTVAIKVLSSGFTADPGLRARFEREARAVSSLDHPNICILHDIGRDGDVDYIVMQYLEGETLAARLVRGPLPLDEALRYAIDIAGALDKAHRAGILHRDLKPGNVMLSRSAGRDTSARLLDFGLAKLVSAAGMADAQTVPPTASSPLTGRGTILGTLLYMSPEQLEGQEVDARSDIFSFGALLYEMVTGRRAFDGTSQASIIGAILERDPPPMAAAVPLTPSALDRVVRKCLAKDRERRWQSAGDLGDELTWIAQSSGVHAQPSGPLARRRTPTPLTLLAAASVVLVLAAALMWLLWPRSDPPARFARHLAITLPHGLELAPGGLAASPDGRTIVFAASAVPATGDGASQAAVTRLYVRRFDSPEVTPIAGTEGARSPFFSPDGLSVGYLTASALMKVSLRGGVPARIVSMPPVTRGAVWLPDDSIVVAPTQSHFLMRTTADGAAPLTELDQAQGERAHLWPQLLPGGEDILYTIRRATASGREAMDVGLVHVPTGARRVLVKGGAFAQYSPTGHLLFVRAGALSAAPFDLATKAVTGPAVPVFDGVSVDPWAGGAHYSVTADGTILVFRGPFRGVRHSPVWVDRSGRVLGPLGGIASSQPRHPRISPGGSHALFTATSPAGDAEVYVADLARGTAVRLSNDPQDDFNAVWAPDGRHAVWTALPSASMPLLVRRPVDASAPITSVMGADVATAQFVGSFSPSGDLAYTRATASDLSDIWVLRQNGEPKAIPFVTTGASEYGPEFSPDGRWIAYMSNESGTYDVYVAPYPGPGATRRVTSGGGVSPAWSRDGRELFFQTTEGLMSLPVTPGAELQFGTPRLVFPGAFIAVSREDGPREYDVTPDGKRFIMLVAETLDATAPAFHVVFDWTADLRPDRR